MCQTALIFFFQNGAYALYDVEISPVFGAFVGADVIRQSVFQPTDTYFFVHGDRGHLLSPECSRACKESKQEHHVFEMCFHLF